MQISGQLDLANYGLKSLIDTVNIPYICTTFLRMRLFSPYIVISPEVALWQRFPLGTCFLVWSLHDNCSREELQEEVELVGIDADVGAPGAPYPSVVELVIESRHGDPEHAGGGGRRGKGGEAPGANGDGGVGTDGAADFVNDAEEATNLVAVGTVGEEPPETPNCRRESAGCW